MTIKLFNYSFIFHFAINWLIRKLDVAVVNINQLLVGEVGDVLEVQNELDELVLF
jgi:hypothetical protein